MTSKDLDISDIFGYHELKIKMFDLLIEHTKKIGGSITTEQLQRIKNEINNMKLKHDVAKAIEKDNIKMEEKK